MPRNGSGTARITRGPGQGYGRARCVPERGGSQESHEFGQYFVALERSMPFASLGTWARGWDRCGVGHTLFRRPADFCFPGLAGSGSACPISFLGSYDVERRAISWRRRSVLSENPAEGLRRNLLEVEPGLDTECSGLIGQEADTGPGPPLPIERQERDLVSQVVDEERDVPSASPNTCSQVEQVV